MIKSWTDADTGVTHYADEHSKAYRKRVEREPEQAGTVESGLVHVEQGQPVEPASEPMKRARTSKPAEDSPS